VLARFLDPDLFEDAAPCRHWRAPRRCCGGCWRRSASRRPPGACRWPSPMPICAQCRLEGPDRGGRAADAGRGIVAQSPAWLFTRAGAGGLGRGLGPGRGGAAARRGLDRGRCRCGRRRPAPCLGTNGADGARNRAGQALCRAPAAPCADRKRRGAGLPAGLLSEGFEEAADPACRPMTRRRRFLSRSRWDRLRPQTAPVPGGAGRGGARGVHGRPESGQAAAAVRASGLEPCSPRSPRLDAGAAGDLRGVSEGIATLRGAGLEDIARRTALQLLLLDRRG
jgi:hypothetical protein